MISLDQWRALVAVVDAGGYAQASARLHKSQSAVTYAVQKLESRLGVKAFEIRGRKAVLTPTGELLVRRARALLEEAGALERIGRTLSAGWEAEIGIAAEIVFPSALLLQCLARFGAESPHTRIEVIESVLGGTPEALVRRQADLAISGMVPPGFLGDSLMRLRFLLVAHRDHALHRLGRKLSLQDLRAHRQLIVRESSGARATRPTVEATQRWTVSHMATSLEAVRTGHGYAWMPEERIRDDLAQGTLKPLLLREGAERYVELYLIFADPDAAGPGTRRLAEIIREQAALERARTQSFPRSLSPRG
ncbi:MAG: LysR family transcriptional regulator [Burkholderiales bacterium]|nr:LysR family transcriptional regulator [Burkholderiales bacterium]